MQKTSSQAEAQILCHSNEGRNPGPALSGLLSPMPLDPWEERWDEGSGSPDLGQSLGSGGSRPYLLLSFP